MSVYVVTYHTESGDKGCLGVLSFKPDRRVMDALAKANQPEDYAAGTCYADWSGPFEVDPEEIMR